MVLLAHVPLTQTSPVPPLFGFEIGVDLFFVISGFVVALATEKQISVRQFTQDRLLRVMPLYYVLSAMALLTLGVWGAPLNVVWNTFLLLPVFDRLTYTNPALYLGWSIAFEIWLYALVGLAMWLSRRHWHLVFTFGIAALLVQGYFAPQRMLVLHFIGTPLMLEFLMGVWLCKSRLTLRPVLALCAAAFACYLMLTNMQARPYLAPHGSALSVFGIGMLRAITWGIPCAMLIVACVSLERVGFDAPRVLVWFGGWSYSFYLMQPFTVKVVEALAFEVWALRALTFFIANCIGGYVVYRGLERPLMTWRKRLAEVRMLR